jgi:hypothetical protein
MRVRGGLDPVFPLDAIEYRGQSGVLWWDGWRMVVGGWWLRQVGWQATRRLGKGFLRSGMREKQMEPRTH